MNNLRDIIKGLPDDALENLNELDWNELEREAEMAAALIPPELECDFPEQLDAPQGLHSAPQGPSPS
jgi:hypothetical protein